MRRLTAIAAILLASGACFAVSGCQSSSIRTARLPERIAHTDRACVERQDATAAKGDCLPQKYKNSGDQDLHQRTGRQLPLFRAGTAMWIMKCMRSMQGARSDTKTLSGFDSRKQVNITLKIKGK